MTSSHFSPSIGYNKRYNDSQLYDLSSPQTKKHKGSGIPGTFESRVSLVSSDPGASNSPSPEKVDELGRERFASSLPNLLPGLRTFEPRIVSSALLEQVGSEDSETSEEADAYPRLPYILPLIGYDLDEEALRLYAPLRSALDRLPSDRPSEERMATLLNKALASEQIKSNFVLVNDIMSLFHLKAAFIFLNLEKDKLDFHADNRQLNLTHAFDALNKSEERLQKLGNQPIWLTEYEVFNFDEEDNYSGTSSALTTNYAFAMRKALVLFLKSYCALKLDLPPVSDEEACSTHEALHLLKAAKKLIDPYFSVSSKEIHNSLSLLNSNIATLHREIADQMHDGPCYATPTRTTTQTSTDYEKASSFSSSDFLEQSSGERDQH